MISKTHFSRQLRRTGRPRVLHLPLAIALPMFLGLVTLSVGALTLGVLETRMSTIPVDTEYRALVEAQLDYGWAVVLLGTLAAVIGGGLISWAIVHPLRRLATHLEEMAEGGRGDMLELAETSEFAGLAGAYNRLVMSTSKYLPERSRYIFHNLASGVLAYSGDGHVDTVNAAVDELLELQGRGVGNLHLREAFASVGEMDELIELLEEPVRVPGASLSREVEIVTGSGTRKTLGVSITSVPNATKDGYDVVATMVDLSTVKDISSQMLQQEKLAAVGSLASGVAHEIRNPLASLKAIAQLLSEGKTSQQQHQEYLGVIVSEVDRLNDVVSRLVDFARPREEELDEVDLNVVVRDVLRLSNHQAYAKGINVSTSLPPYAPVRGRRGQLVQALLNIVLNGVEAVPNNGELELHIEAGDPVVVRIANNGPSIVEEDLPRIFTPYHTTKEGGMGLGLAITQQLVAQHNGTIRVENRPEGGVAFTIELPGITRETATDEER